MIERVKHLRNQMKKHQLSAFIIPSSDPHQGEYVADRWQSRAWISGFTGSAGTAVVTLDDAGVWTDSRYFIQGENELKDSPFTLHKVYNQSSPQYMDWIIAQLKSGQSVGCDGRLFSQRLLNTYKKKLDDHNIKLVTDKDLIDHIWEQRPPLPTNEIYELKIEFAGEARASKLKRIREVMRKEEVSFHLISTLDDIAWTLNIRGSDVSFNPVAYCYFLIGKERSTLYIDRQKVSTPLLSNLEQDHIDLKPYDEIWKDLNELPVDQSILIDKDTVSYALHRAINASVIQHMSSPAGKFKAVKNEVEIQHFRNVMVKDGVALVKFYRWLEENIEDELTEFDLVHQLARFRSQQPGYVSESFNAIVGYKGNGAIVHYRPSKESSSTLSKDGMLLIDSGGQYMDGTTDITRTITLGNPSTEEKQTYTLVLKGNIELDRAVFPEGTLGVQLDTLARIHLWRERLNFLHGTGHGIGFFLNVHEGPQGFYPGIASRSKVSIDEYMITTNEPGYYKEGAFGIRIENCLLTVKASEGFLKFETLTLYPISTDLIEFSMLTKDEVDWLNNYHTQVYAQLSPHLSEEERLWLMEKCKHI